MTFISYNHKNLVSGRAPEDLTQASRIVGIVAATLGIIRLSSDIQLPGELLVETLRNVGDSARIGNHPVDSLFNCEILEADLARVQRIDEPL